MNNLPKYWVVKIDATNPNWKKVIEYLNKTYGVDYAGNHAAYYGYDRCACCSYKLSNFRNNPVELTIDEFVAMTEGEQFTRGEVVEVRGHDGKEWQKRIYLTTVQGAVNPYTCVYGGYEEEFKKGEPFDTARWAQIRKLQPKTILTLQEIADKFGVPVEQLRLKD